MALACGLSVVAGAAVAHPHVFIDTGLEVIFDAQNRVTALRITWTYDDLTSLQLIADQGMDVDFDGVLTPEETVALNGFDMQWGAGVIGDTYASLAGQPLAISGPSDWTVDYKDSKITSTHLRSFAEPVALGDQVMLLQSYDPTLYVGYYLTLEQKLTGAAGCRSRVVKPDLDAAQTKLAAEIAALPVDAEVSFPELGADFAEGLEVSCAASF
jgi:ABC-type uncharacterized transport system substrate-binding protein